MIRTSKRVAVAIQALVAMLLLPVPLAARPVPVVHPGGVAAADTVVLEFPVAASPVLRALRAGPGASPDAASRAGAVRGISGGSTAAGEAGGASASGTDAAPAARSGDALVFSGSKSLAVELGSRRDASLHQALDLTVRGRVAGDVDVSATLSDQRLPFEASGDTRELDDLDRLSVSVRAPRAGATFGDFQLTSGRGEFARVSRQLQGVQGNAQVAGSTWDVAAASAKGERRSLEARGEEGKQGPYVLVPQGVGSFSEGVVAGSERVVLDGEELHRGADADYVVDYGAGTLTFTTHRPITAQSRIAVDFEASAGRFRRSLYAASTQGRASRSAEWYASYLREGDDPHAPLDAAITAEDRQALAALGDSAAGSTGGGVRYAGPGNGDYVWDVSDAANPHWSHLGVGRGDYLVEFTRVGPGRGSYADTLGTDGTRFYRWLGRNLGEYLAGGSLPVPSIQALFDLGGAVNLSGALSLEGELARSGHDQNELSALDDGDNAGTAGRVSIKLDTRSLAFFGRSLGVLRGRATLRSVGDRFRPLDRVEAAFEGERWNQASTSTGERRREVGLEYEPLAALRISGEWGLRDLAGGSHAARRAAGATLSGSVAGALRFEEAVNGQGRAGGSRSRLSAELARARGAITPQARLLEERIRGQEGDSLRARWSREVGAGLGLAPGAAIKLRGAYTLRLERRDDAAGAEAGARAGTWEGSASLKPHGALSLDLGFTRRRLRDRGITTASDLSTFALLVGRPAAPVSSEIRYDVTQLREPALTRRIVFVGGGSGSYDANGNPQLGGGYEAVSERGAPATRSRATLQFRLDAFPGRAAPRGAQAAFWRGLGGSTFLRVETLSRLPLGQPRYALSPVAYLDPVATLRGNVNARQTLDFAPAGARYDLHVEAGTRRDRIGEYAGLRLVSDGTDARVRVRGPLPRRLRFAGTATVDRSVRATERLDGDPGDRSETRGRGLELEVTRALSSAWAVSLLSRARRDLDRAHGATHGSWAVGPTARCAAGGRLRLDARALYARTAQRGMYAPSGLYLLPVLGPRVEYNFQGEYRLRDQVSLTLSFQGERRFRGADVYSGTFELRSWF